ncbi:MAG TPA: acetylxylan esterase [Candidatus Nitrosotalea sp.]|nr:acetylxylan esterase [Candidatus Nitrosotalea sp.]
MKTRIAHLLHGLSIVALALSSSAQETAAQRHQMATNQLKQVAAEMSARCLDEIRTLDDWKARRQEFRRQLREMLGLDPLPIRTPLKVEINGVLERDAYRIEKIVFQSMPGLFVTGNFYVPRGPARSSPTILYLCGHSPNPNGAKVEYQERANWYAAHGYPCLILDTLEFGEVAGIHHGTHNLNMWNWLSLGYTPAGVEVWNAMRAIDYLETRPEVDKSRIGLTGISGGGAMTWYTAAVDERVAVAAPVCSTFTFGSQAEHWIASGQCDCIYYHNTYGWDFPVVGALIAPRPLLIISGQKDTIFPPDGYHAVFQRAKKIYDLYAGTNSERIRELDDNVGHSDPPLFLRGARQWMRRWLSSSQEALPDETGTPTREAPEELACLTRIPEGAINFRIQNQFTVSASLTNWSSQGEWQQRRAALLAQLKDKVFRWFPSEPVPFDAKVSTGNSGYMLKYADYREISFQTEPGVRVRSQLLTPKMGAGGKPMLIYVKRAGDSIYSMDTDELLPLLGRYTVMILHPRFTELPMTATERTDVERTAAWVGRTIAAMQVWDILRAVRWALDEEKIPASSLALYGKGDMGILAVYSALFEPRVNQVIVTDPSPSHWQSPALLNVLRVTDIPEVAGALAPRRLVSLTKLPENFAYTRRIFRLQGASNQFTQSGSLPEALEVWKQSRSSTLRDETAPKAQ